MPEYPAGRWTKVTPRANSPLVDAEPIDICDDASLATAIEIVSACDEIHELAVFRQAGPEDFPVDVRVVAGNIRSRNRIIVYVDVSTSRESEELHASVIRYVEAIVKAWDPDWLKAGTPEFNKQQPIKRVPGEVYVGWYTYISDRIPIDEDILDAGKVERIGCAGGQYIMLDGTPTEPSLEQALLIRKALGYTE
ncbi:hypothetical protein [Gordonia sesuvii]